MKKLILLAFMLVTNVFAGEIQEKYCGYKSLSYCITESDKLCDNYYKNYDFCFITGVLYEEQEQYSQAKKYYEMVCDKANSKNTYEVKLYGGQVFESPAIFDMKDACVALGRLYYNGHGVKQDYKKTLHYHKKACDLGRGKSCAFVGIAYEDGKGVTKDLKTAIAFHAKSCKLKSSVGCFVLGVFYHNGKGVKQNYSKAKELFGKACDLGDQGGCDLHKELEEKGY